MHEINSPAQLKASARNGMTGHYSFLILVLFTGFIVLFLFSIFCDVPPVTFLLMQLFSFHISRIYLMTLHGEKAAVMDLFAGNPDHKKETQAIGAACIITLIHFLCMLPSDILYRMMEPNSSASLFLLYCIAFSVGLVIFCLLYLNLFPVYYLVSDCPAETMTETLKMAVFLSKGHRFRLFYLIAGFLPLFLLSMLSFGIGLLWVIPYMQATLTYFYLNLTENKSA